MLGPRTQAWEEGYSLEGDPVLQPHFLVCQHGAVLIQDQRLLQMPGRVSESLPPQPQPSPGSKGTTSFPPWPPLGPPKGQREGPMGGQDVEVRME